jgi:Ser/Thr protein kinase RdoA (MazF antagonist)
MERELEHVLRSYPLGNLTDARRLQRGSVNESWVVSTTGGRFFVKCRHPSYHHKSLIHAQHALIEHLRRHRFPAPRLLRTLTDETFVVLDGQWYEIQEFIDGEPYDHQRTAHLEQAAATLGMYHRCVRGFGATAFHSLPDLYAPATVHSLLQRLVSAERLKGDPSLPDLTRHLDAEAFDLALRFARHRTPPRLIIHGDYYADNLIFEGDRIVGVVDYDRARAEPRVTELAEALIYFASPQTGHMRHIVYPGVLDWEPFCLFLQSYGQAISLEDGEAQALPDYVGTIWLSWSLRRLLERGLPQGCAAEALQEVCSLADWARANADQMIEAAYAAMRS